MKKYPLTAFLRNNKKRLSPLLILTHDFPDPDALASAYGLYFLADTVFKIPSRIAYRGVIGRAENKNMVSLLQLPIHRLRAGDLEEFHNIALVDTQPKFENNPFGENRKAAIVLDQHAAKENPLADFFIVDSSCGATAILLAREVLALKKTIPEKLATALVYGIMTDTLNFFRVQRKDIIETYFQILPFCNMRTLARIQTPFYDRRYISTLGKAIHQAFMNKGLLVSHLGKVSTPDMVSEIADFLLSYKKTKWALSTGRFNDKLYVSLRTSQRAAAAFKILRQCVARPADAGGHGRIAGGSVKIGKAGPAEWRRQEKRLVKKIKQVLGIGRETSSVYPFRD